MSIGNIIKYIEHRNNNPLKRGHDDFSGFVCDAISSHLTNSNARTLMTNLLIGDDKATAQLLRDFLIAEYGEKAEQFATDNAPLSPAEQRFYDAKPAHMSNAQYEAGIKDGEL